MRILLCKEVPCLQNMKLTLQLNALKSYKAVSHINTKETPIFQSLSLFPPLGSNVMNDTTSRYIGAESSLAKKKPKGEQWAESSSWSIMMQTYTILKMS
jgi:hypothetical protein